MLVHGGEKTATETAGSTASLMQSCAQSGGVRPFGCSILACGLDEDSTPLLFQVDSCGVSIGLRAAATGKGYVSVKGFLEKIWNEEVNDKGQIKGVRGWRKS